MDLKDFVGDINLEESAGLGVTVAFADIHDIQTFPELPDLEAGMENGDYVDLGNKVFTFKPGKCFKRFNGTLEKNAFASALEGPRGSMSFRNTLTIQRSAMNKGVVGFMRANRNREMIVAFKPLGSSQWVILGWDELPAMFTAGAIDVPAEISGEKMTQAQIVGIFYPPLYIDSISFTPAAAPSGD
jgi:hypothetical protein